VTATNKLSFHDPAAVHVWRASLVASQTEIEACAALLDADELTRARRFHFQRDRDRFTLARGLLRTLLGRYLELEPKAVRFAYGPSGKPFLAASESTLRFNLSHSGTQALFVFAPARELGIDLEAGLRLGDDWPALACRIFSVREQAELAAMPPERRRDAFLNGWTRKEAYLKAIGHGLVNGLDKIEVTLDPGQPAAFLSLEVAHKWRLFDLREGAGAAAALVVEGGTADIQIFTISATHSGDRESRSE
jgi:4'-phosphopantetheinyl transferase